MAAGDSAAGREVGVAAGGVVGPDDDAAAVAAVQGVGGEGAVGGEEGGGGGGEGVAALQVAADADLSAAVGSVGVDLSAGDGDLLAQQRGVSAVAVGVRDVDGSLVGDAAGPGEGDRPAGGGDLSAVDQRQGVDVAGGEEHVVAGDDAVVDHARLRIDGVGRVALAVEGVHVVDLDVDGRAVDLEQHLVAGGQRHEAAVGEDDAVVLDLVTHEVDAGGGLDAAGVDHGGVGELEAVEAVEKVGVGDLRGAAVEAGHVDHGVVAEDHPGGVDQVDLAVAQQLTVDA